MIEAGAIGGVHSVVEDFATTDFAAAPFTCNPETGGAYNDRTVCDYTEVTNCPR